MNRFALLLFIIALVLTACRGDLTAEQTPPNVLLIVADDMGYSDLGVFGSEIETPNIDAIARNGVTLTNFHANATCSTSRAMLLTGVDNHAVGFGANTGAERRFPEIAGKPGYRGEFVEGVKTLASRFRDAGYNTYMAGKWHLGTNKSSLPPAQGYVKSFYFEHGGASHFADAKGNLSTATPAHYREGDQLVEELPADFFSTTYYTDRLIDYIENASDRDKPFFAHLAYTAPHWPLQVPEDWLDKYAGKYDRGWEATRRDRLSRMLELSLIDAGTEVGPLPVALGKWDDLTDDERRHETRRMELYASMISQLDFEVGRLVQYLKDSGNYENTVIVFLSDNGPEGNDIGVLRDNATWLPENFDLSYENMGRPESYVWLGRGWAHVSAGPLSLYKSYLAEGGTRVPAIIRLPTTAERGVYFAGLTSILDIMPTLLDLAGIEVDGSEKLSGVSLLPALTSVESPAITDRSIAMEIYGGRAVFENNWKLLWLWPPQGAGRWQLFDLSVDPGETNDLAAEYPEVVQRLSETWDEFADANDVFRTNVDNGYGRYPDQRPKPFSTEEKEERPWIEIP